VGYLIISMNELPKSCSHRRAIVPTNHPLYNTIYKMAIEAKTNNLPLQITYGDTCNYRSTGLDLLIATL
jgi:hypothetical protein